MSGPARRRIRIAIVGSCQVRGLREWLARLVTDADIASWHVGSSPAATPELILPHLRDYDVIVSQIEDGTERGLLDLARLRALCGNVVFLPILVFRGFHPDCLVRLRPDHRVLEHPLTRLFHSAIVMASFRLGVAPHRVPALFNTLVFRGAGHLSVFAEARAALFDNFEARGYDLRVPFAKWMEQGAFMYTDNHPHIRVLGTLARLFAEKAGLPMVAAVTPPRDDLADSFQWPVYPDLARAIGVAGETVFRRAADHVAPGEAREVTLAAFVDASYRFYAEAGDVALLPDPVADATYAALRDLLVGGDIASR